MIIANQMQPQTYRHVTVLNNTDKELSGDCDRKVTKSKKNLRHLWLQVEKELETQKETYRAPPFVSDDTFV